MCYVMSCGLSLSSPQQRAVPGRTWQTLETASETGSNCSMETPSRTTQASLDLAPLQVSVCVCVSLELAPPLSVSLSPSISPLLSLLSLYSLFTLLSLYWLFSLTLSPLSPSTLCSLLCLALSLISLCSLVSLLSLVSSSTLLYAVIYS